MPKSHFAVGERFPLHLVWRLPSGDFIRVVIAAEVLALDSSLDRYLLRLDELITGRQEAPDGQLRLRSELAAEYWAMVGRIMGKKVHLAYEVDDGRPIHLRLATLTGEHTLFSRLDDGAKKGSGGDAREEE
jgi:hypothetical protein